MTYEQAMERIKAFIRQHDSSTDPDIGLDMALGAIQYHIDELEDKANKRIAEIKTFVISKEDSIIEPFDDMTATDVCAMLEDILDKIKDGAE